MDIISTQTFGIENLDLIAVGITMAGIGVLGFVIFLSNKRSSTNRVFLAISIITILYTLFNYVSYQDLSGHQDAALWIMRIMIFFAVWYSFIVFHLSYVFPKHKVSLPIWYTRFFIPAVSFVSVLTLTPLVFQSIESFSDTGRVVEVIYGPAIPIFGIVAISLVVGSFVLLFRKTYLASGIERRQFLYVLIGASITYSLLIVFNLLLPVILDNVSFIPFAPIFILPFIAFTAYAIVKHRLFDTRVLASEIFVFLFAVITLFQLVLSQGIYEIMARFTIFVFVLIFGIMLIDSVIKEVKGRQQMMTLAQELTVANQRLRRLDQQKSEFISIASHQLRGPLTAIKGYSSLLLEGSYGNIDEKPKEAIKKIFVSSERLVGMVNEFLNISKIEQGSLTYQFASVDFDALVRGVLAEYQKPAQEKDLKVSYKNSGDMQFYVTADEGKLRQIVSNLIENAVKYTPKGGIMVYLAKNRPAGKITLSVSDSGIGISQEDIGQLFKKFSRGKDVGRVYTEGSGLGLYVARMMLEEHKGRIWAESKGEGEGSTFYVELLAEEHPVTGAEPVKPFQNLLS